VGPECPYRTRARLNPQPPQGRGTIRQTVPTNLLKPSSANHTEPHHPPATPTRPVALVRRSYLPSGTKVPVSNAGPFKPTASPRPRNHPADGTYQFTQTVKRKSHRTRPPTSNPNTARDTRPQVPIVCSILPPPRRPSWRCPDHLDRWLPLVALHSIPPCRVSFQSFSWPRLRLIFDNPAPFCQTQI
jgi:hypothetical protein